MGPAERRRWALAVSGFLLLAALITLAASGGGGWGTASGAGLDEAGSAEQATNSSDAGGDDGSCEWPALPADVRVREVFWTVMQKFVITSGEHEEVQHGYVEAAGFSFGDEKTWYSNDRKVIAKIDRNVKSITEIVNAPLHVRDCNDQKMALVNEELVAGSLSQGAQRRVAASAPPFRKP